MGLESWDYLESWDLILGLCNVWDWTLLERWLVSKNGLLFFQIRNLKMKIHRPILVQKNQFLQSINLQMKDYKIQMIPTQKIMSFTTSLLSTTMMTMTRQFVKRLKSMMIRMLKRVIYQIQNANLSLKMGWTFYQKQQVFLRYVHRYLKLDSLSKQINLQVKDAKIQICKCFTNIGFQIWIKVTLNIISVLFDVTEGCFRM